MATYRVYIEGYGAEMIFARITKEQYEYWKPLKDEGSDAIEQHLFCDPYEDDEGNEITDDTDPRWLGMWYDMEGTIEHCHGAEVGSACLRVYNDENEMILEKDISAGTVEADETNANTEGEGYYISAQSSETGTFFAAELNVDGDIDPSKFNFHGVTLVSFPMVGIVDYDGEDLEDEGGATSGKGYHVEFIKNSPE